MKSYFNLERLFDYQINNLNLSNEIAFKEANNVLTNPGSRKYILDLAANFGFENGNLPFLIVLSRHYFDFELLMSKVRSEYVYFRGESSISNIDIVDELKFSIGKVYCIFDVENGLKTLGLNPVMIAKNSNINTYHRQYMNADEIIALGIHSNVLKRRNVWAVNSYCNKNENKIVALISYLRQPRLIFADPTNHSLWGTPSYKDSFVLL